ncbi:MAG TPA: PspC domain-containing protein [Solirubrobacteraceae bacterium]|nr:PspC domain-containing protein [Solirubrobacteraceae bacterium]
MPGTLQPMEPDDPTPEQDPTTEQAAAPPPPPPPQSPRLVRSRGDRVIAGVCGGLAEHFRIDPIIVRVAAVALIFAGGAGLLLYLAGVLLLPEGEEPAGSAAAAPARSRGSAATIAGAVALVVAIGILIPGGFFLGAVVVPLAALALVALAVWWLSSGERPGGPARDVVRRIALGLGVLILCGALACAAFWAGATGGGTVVAALVIGAGVIMIGAAFLGGARWLILPALALALPLALVSAAGVEADNSVGDRSYVPRSADQIRDRYELGMGRLVVDLRQADLPPGDHTIHLQVGVGEAEVLVPRDVCVATDGRVGVGGVELFDRDSGGLDVDVDDRPRAARHAARVIVDADVGIGAFRVGYDEHRAWNGHDGFDLAPDQGVACR